MQVTKRRLKIGALLCAVIALVSGARLALAQPASQPAAAPVATASANGFAARRPIFGGSCSQCPWGAMGDIVKQVMAPAHYDIQICYGCAGGPREVRLVAAAAAVPDPTPEQLASYRRLGLDPAEILHPPQGRIDFGATSTNYLTWAYEGAHDFRKDGPQRNLRLIAVIPSPFYLVVAVRKDLGVHDLSQLKGLGRPLRVLWDGPMWESRDAADPQAGDGWSRTVLAYYGLSPDDIVATGGEMKNGIVPSQRKDFDLLIYAGDQSAAPEFNVLSEVSQTHDLEYLPLAEPLRDALAARFNMQKRDLPPGFLRGVVRPTPTVAVLGNAIYGRADMPDDFAYALAKALDTHRDAWLWGHEHFAYSRDLVSHNDDVPLHPGAARYYRERHVR